MRAHFGLALLLVLGARATAHDGPPYAIITAQPCGPRVLELWADPDIGTGRFWILLSVAPGGVLAPPDEVRVAIAPSDGSAPEGEWPARRLTEKNDLEYYAEVQFPAGGWWTTRVRIRDGTTWDELVVGVEATPPGAGPWGFVIFLFPFVGFGFIFLRLALKRRRACSAAG